MRVIAGVARGVPLVAPKDRGTRPITDRVKETLFAILGDAVVDARVLDGYAGSGAIGIEALSRGAAHCTFVERARPALAAIERNLAKTGLGAGSRVVAGDVLRVLGDRPPAAAYDLAILDPPYGERDIVAALERLVPWLAPGARVVVKHFWRDEIAPGPGLAVARRRRFGETALTFLVREPAVAARSVEER